MGAWGHDYQENDGYLDLLGDSLDRIESILARSKRINRFKRKPNGKHVVDRKNSKTISINHSDKWYKEHESNIVNASGLLYDILQNESLYYPSEKDMVYDAWLQLERVLDICDFKGWTKPEERKKNIEHLKNKLYEIWKTREVRYTTLSDKLANEPKQ